MVKFFALLHKSWLTNFYKNIKEVGYYVSKKKNSCIAADLTNYRQYLIIGKSVAVSDINADGESDIRDLVNIK